MGLSGVQNGSPTVNSQHRCQCVGDLLAPIRSKMKVLKKFKKRIRPTRNGSGRRNNQPPILFHQVHGDNIRISEDGTIARRVESFCRGVTFSARPIKIHELVCVKFLEVSNNWSGVIRFGFTSNDPGNLRYGLPKYACPDLTNKPGYWAKALAERFAEKDTVLFYYVTSCGDVRFGINGEEQGVFIRGVETKGSLWAMFDVYGNSTGIELVDNRSIEMSDLWSNEHHPDGTFEILPSLQSLFIRNVNQRSERVTQTDCGIVSRYQRTGIELSPFPLHRTRGPTIHISNDRSIATRIHAQFCLGYVFTSRPVRLGEEIIIQVLETDSFYAGGLTFGLTSCDPATLQTCDLPEDADSLLDRPEYWVLQKHVANVPKRGDELAFSVLHTGEVQVSKNRGPPYVFMHVDHTLQLWAFFDLYGTTRGIRVLETVSRPHGNSPPPSAPVRLEPPSNRFRISSPSLDYRNESMISDVPLRACVSPSYGIPHPYCCSSGNTNVTQSTNVTSPSAEVVRVQSSAAGGTVLVVKIPPVQSNYINQHVQQQRQQLQQQQHQQQQQQRLQQLPRQQQRQQQIQQQHGEEQGQQEQHQQLLLQQQQEEQQEQQQRRRQPEQQQLTSRHSPPSYRTTYPHLTQNNSSSSADREQIPSGTVVTNFSNTDIEPITSTSYPTLESGTQFGEVMAATTGSECSICYERTIDSVLYQCGHMCMCYECAVQQWRGKGGGHCPLCRAVIRDVIRTYKS